MADPRGLLFDAMAAARVGMLGVQGSALPLQPMVPLVRHGVPDVWFLAEADSDLVKTLGAGEEAGLFCLTGRGHDLFASVTGPMRCVADRRGLEAVWSHGAEAVFPGGLSDIEWMPLHLRMREVALWTGGGAGGSARPLRCVIRF